MTYGVELINDYGKVSISTEYSNFYFYTKRTGNLPSSNPIKKVISTGITNSATRPLVYHYIPDGGAIYSPVGVYYSSGEWKVEVWGEPSAPYELYIFAQNIAQSSGWGMQVFGPTGDIYFDSSYGNIAVIGMATINRAADHFWDLYEEVGTFDEWYGAWLLGYGEATIPASARVPKLCISAPPAFFGSGSTDYGGNGIFDIKILLSAIHREGDKLKVCTNKAGQFTGYYSAIATNQDVMPNRYSYSTAPSSDPAISDPIWSSYQVSFIDGSLLD